MTDRLTCTARLDPDSPTPVLLVPQVQRFVDANLASRLIHVKQARAWAGTRLATHAARVFVLKLDPRLARRLAACEDRLGRWTHSHDPPLPEDLCAFRHGARLPVLVSVTHEGRAWILSDRPPASRLAEPSVDPDLLDFVPDAPEFLEEAE